MLSWYLFLHCRTKILRILIHLSYERNKILRNRLRVNDDFSTNWEYQKVESPKQVDIWHTTKIQYILNTISLLPIVEYFLEKDIPVKKRRRKLLKKNEISAPFSDSPLSKVNYFLILNLNTTLYSIS